MYLHVEMSHPGAFRYDHMTPSKSVETYLNSVCLSSLGFISLHTDIWIAGRTANNMMKKSEIQGLWCFFLSHKIEDLIILRQYYCLNQPSVFLSYLIKLAILHTHRSQAVGSAGAGGLAHWEAAQSSYDIQCTVLYGDIWSPRGASVTWRFNANVWVENKSW